MVKDWLGREFIKDKYADENQNPKYKAFRSKKADSHGFDKSNTEENDKYYIKHILHKGDIIVRYGPETGRYFTTDKTPYKKLSLPYKKNSQPLYKYRVIADNMKRYGVVDKGKVAPGFGNPGGGVQYYSVRRCASQLVKKNILERIYEKGNDPQKGKRVCYIKVSSFDSFSNSSCIEFAKLLAENGCDVNLCSFGSYREGCICLEFVKGRWSVYVAENGCREDRHFYSNLVNAFQQIVKIITDKKSTEETIIQKLQDRFCNNEKSPAKIICVTAPALVSKKLNNTVAQYQSNSCLPLMRYKHGRSSPRKHKKKPTKE